MIATSYDEYKYELKNYFRCFVMFVCYEYDILFFEYKNYLRRRNIKCVIFFREEVFLEALLVACSGPRNVCSSYYRSIKMFCWNFLAVSHEKRIENYFIYWKLQLIVSSSYRLTIWPFLYVRNHRCILIVCSISAFTKNHCLLDNSYKL